MQSYFVEGKRTLREDEVKRQALHRSLSSLLFTSLFGVYI